MKPAPHNSPTDAMLEPRAAATLIVPPKGPHVRRVTIALAGAGDSSAGGNPDFEEAAKAWGVTVKPSDNEYTFSTFPSKEPTEAMVEAVMKQLDNNGDGVVDDKDGPVVLNAIGYSWGGPNASRLLTQVLDRLAPNHQVYTRLVTIEPFQLRLKTLRVDPRISQAVNFRVGDPPDDDCSKKGLLGALFGPFNGRPLECSADQDCADYNLSAPAEAFGWTPPPHFSDHCSAPEDTMQLVWILLHTDEIHSSMVPPSSVIRRQRIIP
jgi:pimeloyl-ACP methyl ester carboxylesterase